jgi:hypothetical protein
MKGETVRGFLIDIKARVTKTNPLSDIINLRATEFCGEGKGLKLGQKMTLLDKKMKKDRN